MDIEQAREAKRNLTSVYGTEDGTTDTAHHGVIVQIGGHESGREDLAAVEGHLGVRWFPLGAIRLHPREAAAAALLVGTLMRFKHGGTVIRTATAPRNGAVHGEYVELGERDARYHPAGTTAESLNIFFREFYGSPHPGKFDLDSLEVVPPTTTEEPPTVTDRFVTKADVIEQAIAPALSGVEGHYDMQAIADAAFIWKVDTDEHGNELLNTGGFVQCVGEERFWQIVERHADQGISDVDAPA